MKDPVCPLVLALYGHPDSGGFWEKHCDAHLRTIGFEPIEDWLSCYWHDETRSLLVVYVDDFKLAGPADQLEHLWDSIRDGLTMDPPTEQGKYLGCDHIVRDVISPLTGNVVRSIEYDMSSFLEQAVDRYLELVGRDASFLSVVQTPFETPNKKTNVTGAPIECQGVCPMCGARCCASRPSPATNEGPFDCLSHNADGDGLSNTVGSISAESVNTRAAKLTTTLGEESTSSKPAILSVLAKLLYAARMARYDLLRCVCGLMARAHVWTTSHDRQLYRLVSYVQ